jgi:hypothetical protein
MKNAAEPITRQWHDILSNDAEHGIDAIFSGYYTAPKNLCFGKKMQKMIEVIFHFSAR